MNDKAVFERIAEAMGDMVVEKPADMPIDEFCKIMRDANRRASFGAPRQQDGPPRDWPYLNGTVWESQSYMRCVLMFLGDGFTLASFGQHYAGWPAMTPNNYHAKDGKWLYTHEELPERLKNWHCLGYWSGHEEMTVKEFLSPEDFAELGDRECTRQ